MPELAPAAGATSPQVVIQNVENLHLHVGPEGIAGIEGLSDLTAQG